MIPLSADMYYDPAWRDWLVEQKYPNLVVIVPEGGGTARHYIDVYIDDPELAVMFRLKFGV